MGEVDEGWDDTGAASWPRLQDHSNHMREGGAEPAGLRNGCYIRGRLHHPIHQGDNFHIGQTGQERASHAST